MNRPDVHTKGGRTPMARIIAVIAAILAAFFSRATEPTLRRMMAPETTLVAH